MLGTPAAGLNRAPATFLTAGTGVRIWTNPKASPNIVVLCQSCLYVTTLVRADLPKAVQMLEGGAVPERLFGSHLKVIPLISVENAEADLRTNTFWFSYMSGIGTSTATFQLVNSYEADELTAVLRQQLGGRYEVGTLGLSLFRVSSLPLMAMAVHSVVAAIAWLLVSSPGGVRRRGWIIQSWLQDNVGPPGVKMFAIAVAAILALWLVSRFFQRPVGVSFRKIQQ